MPFASCIGRCRQSVEQYQQSSNRRCCVLLWFVVCGVVGPQTHLRGVLLYVTSIFTILEKGVLRS